MFVPFKNDHQSMQVGELIIENQTDKVIIYGDIDIYKTRAGLAQAKALQALFADIVNELEQTLSGSNTTTNQSKVDSTSSTANNSHMSKQEQSNLDNGAANKKVNNPFL